METLIGAHLNRYRVIERVGGGSFGVVYRAYDDRLEHDVALKVLPPDFVVDPQARAQLRREALTLSRLSHPNLVTVLDFDSRDDLDFLVMELVPGITLSEVLARGPLPEHRVVALGLQLAEGLIAAHGLGIVHRDIKPGNIRITPDGRLKLIDFGLAAIVERTGSQNETRGAELVGTFAYMAPEQLRGAHASTRTDIYSAGAVLYEMATGARPFAGLVGPELGAAILHADLTPPRELRADLSKGLESTLIRCLDKSPKRRFQSADELHAELSHLPQTRSGVRRAAAATHHTPGRKSFVWLAALAALLVVASYGQQMFDWVTHRMIPPSRSVAVLPLRNLSGDPGQEYFADGLTEAIISQLERVPGLRVISYTTTLKYKATTKTVPEIARELSVRNVIEGSVMRDQNRVRVLVKLLNARETSAWNNAYERDLGDVIDLVDEVSQTIAGSVQARLVPKASAGTVSRPVDPQAYDLYLRGRFAMAQEQVGLALRYFGAAIARDSLWAPPYSGLADCYVSGWFYGDMPLEAVVAGARPAARRSLQLDSTLADAHLAMAYVQGGLDWDWADARRSVEKALDLSPGSAEVHFRLGLVNGVLGRADRFVDELRRSCELDPLSPYHAAYFGGAFYNARRYQEGIDLLTRMMGTPLENPEAHRFLGLCELEAGLPGAAIEELKRVKPEVTAAPDLAYAYARTGDRAAAMQIVQQLEGSVNAPRPPFSGLAMIYAALGDKDRAFGWLDRAYDAHDSGMLWLKLNPRFDPLRSDPRYAALLKRLKLSS